LPFQFSGRQPATLGGVGRRCIGPVDSGRALQQSTATRRQDLSAGLTCY